MSSRSSVGVSRVSPALRRDYLAQAISKRWAEWAPAVRVSGIYGRSADTEATHAQVVRDLLGMGLKLQTIRQTRLDSPFLTPQERKDRLRAYVTMSVKQKWGRLGEGPRDSDLKLHLVRD